MHVLKEMLFGAAIEKGPYSQNTFLAPVGEVSILLSVDG
jgi:hypothetical protein